MLDELAETVAWCLHHKCGIPPESHIAAACSGGADSVALVACLALQRRYRLEGVYFVDHGLRDVSQERESAERAAADAGVPMHSITLELAPGSNIQARARHARYQALEAQVPSGTYIATGHTMTDQAETLLQRLLRGAGLRGLRGIRAQRGRIIRPLMGLTRSQTRALGLPFTDDPTNESDSYQRNRLRRTLLDSFRAEHRDVESALTRTAAQASGEYALLKHYMNTQPMDVQEIRALGFDALQSWLRLNWTHESPPSRGVLKRLATAVMSNRDLGPQRIDSGTTVSVVSGALRFEKQPDPRMRVVATAPGAYLLGCHQLVISEGRARQLNDHESHILEIPSHRITWPLTLQQLNATLDPNGIKVPPQLRLNDGAGVTLWESPREAATLSSGRDFHIALFVC